jgi:hypothetical protein
LKNRKKTTAENKNKQTDRQLNQPAEIETNSPQSSASIFATGDPDNNVCELMKPCNSVSFYQNILKFTRITNIDMVFRVIWVY